MRNKMIIEGFEKNEEGRLWITVENLSVHIVQIDEGVVVDIYSLDHEDENPITSTYAFFNEGIEEE
jgi:hypothetical protein